MAKSSKPRSLTSPPRAVGFDPGGIVDKIAASLSPSFITYSQFVAQELPEAFTVPLGPHQRFMCDELHMDPMGLRLAVGAPRGSGKTTLALFGMPIAAIALGTHQFILLVGPTQEEADARLNMIRAELDRNPAITQRWPRLAYVPRPRSTRRHKVDTAREIQLAGGRILAVGAGAKIRGIVRESTDGSIMRPDLILLDDCENETQARSRLLTDRLEEWLFASLLGMGSARRPVSLIFIGTTLATDSLMTRALKHRGRFSSWNVRAFPIVYKDANNTEHLMWPQYFPWSYVRALTDPLSPDYKGQFTYAREYLLDPHDVIGAMWSEKLISDARDVMPDRTFFRKIVVAVDPSFGTKGDECGIIVAALGQDGHCYILEDLSMRAEPSRWAKIAIDAYEVWQANEIIAEVNFGAENVKNALALIDRRIPFRQMKASRTKEVRFEPVVMLYEQHKVHHVGHTLDRLEHQMLDWVPPPAGQRSGGSPYSPDKIDALTWAVTHLMLGAIGGPAQVAGPTGRIIPMTPRSPVASGLFTSAPGQ